MTDTHQTFNPQHHTTGGMQHQYGGSHYNQQQHKTSPLAHQVVKAATASVAGGSLLVLSGLTLAGTVIALTIATPLLVIFSPVLVPAVITVFLLATGFLTSGGFGVAAVTVLSWIYRYATGGHPPGADSLDQARDKLGYKAREMKGRAEQATGMGHHQTSGSIGHHTRADM
ncbi:oleosin L-like [Rutidosis leptorrhynchoides]|uniref:oleosin L-like n=1 Tax=Rutidosis leptorrhynchoides TaxID=125765 RepID=UPI003A98E22F